VDGHPYRIVGARASLSVFICLVTTLALKSGSAQQKPMPESPAIPEIPQIKADFTLKYSIIVAENQSFDAKMAIYRTNANGMDDAVKEGRMTQEQAERQKAALKDAAKHHDTPIKFSGVLSCHDGKILYRTSGASANVYIWDGTHSYSYDVASKFLSVRSGFRAQPLQELPCPGAAIPGISLLKLPSPGAINLQLRGDVYTQFIGDHGPLYRNGILTFKKSSDGTLLPSAAEWRDDTELNGRYEFSGDAKLNNTHIAQRIRCFEYSGMIPHAPGTDPIVASTTEYILVSSSDQALPDKEFLPASYLQGTPPQHPDELGSVVSWVDASHKVGFPYTPNKTLQEQHNQHAAMADRIAADDKKRNTGRRGIVGPILIVILLIGGAWWLLRRKGNLAS
jgi:hypothetical protein